MAGLWVGHDDDVVLAMYLNPVSLFVILFPEEKY